MRRCASPGGAPVGGMRREAEGREQVAHPWCHEAE